MKNTIIKSVALSLLFLPGISFAAVVTNIQFAFPAGEQFNLDVVRTSDEVWADRENYLRGYELTNPDSFVDTSAGYVPNAELTVDNFDLVIIQTADDPFDGRLWLLTIEGTYSDDGGTELGTYGVYYNANTPPLIQYSGGGGQQLAAFPAFTVTHTEVPVPAAAWLFGSALLGLAGFKRKGH